MVIVLTVMVGTEESAAMVGLEALEDMALEGMVAMDMEDMAAMELEHMVDMV